MSEPVFFERERGLGLAQIVELTGARHHGKACVDTLIEDIASLERGGPGDLAVADRPEDRAVLQVSQAGACLMQESFLAAAPVGMQALVVDDPFGAFVKVATALYPKASRPSSLFESHGVSAQALVHPKARLESGTTIDPGAVIGPDVEIGTGTSIAPMVVIGPGVRIGRNCTIGAAASLTNALLGDRVVVHAGCRIGQEDTGTGSRAGRSGKAPQIGRVILQDGVEVGVNCAIDRGDYRDTVIGEGTTIDALLHVASNTMIGRFCTIVAPQGLEQADPARSPAQAEVGCELMFADGERIPAAAAGRVLRR